MMDAKLKDAFMAGVAFGRGAERTTFWEEVEAEEAAYVEWKKT